MEDGRKKERKNQREDKRSREAGKRQKGREDTYTVV